MRHKLNPHAFLFALIIAAIFGLAGSYPFKTCDETVKSENQTVTTQFHLDTAIIYKSDTTFINSRDNLLWFYDGKFRFRRNGTTIEFKNLNELSRDELINVILLLVTEKGKS